MSTSTVHVDLPSRPAEHLIEDTPMASQSQYVTPDSIWTDPISTSGTFSRVPALVPRSSPSAVLSFDDDGTASGHLTQFEADVTDWVNSVLDPLSWNPAPLPKRATSGNCSYRTPTAWPDGSPAVLFCSRDPKHAGPHEPLDTAGNLMPLPVDDLEEQVA